MHLLSVLHYTNLVSVFMENKPNDEFGVSWPKLTNEVEDID